MSKKPSAQDRTISLFTRKTDLERKAARDGTRSAEPERPPHIRQPSWHGMELGFGDPNARGYERVAHIMKVADGFDAFIKDEKIGHADTVTEAASLIHTRLAKNEMEKWWNERERRGTE